LHSAPHEGQFAGQFKDKPGGGGTRVVALGWVLQVNGRIEPFAHVDCTQIGGVLGAQAQGMDADERNTVMAGAIARVIVHEWIHIAAQSSSHAERGIENAQFGEADLMDLGSEPVARLRNP